MDTPKKCGYCGWILIPNTNFLQHSCFASYNEDCHNLVYDENFIVTIEDKDNANCLESGGDNEPEINTDELLISCVAQKRALFDHRVPASDRTNLKKKELWQEVSNLMGGVLNVDELQKRWKYLRDCYLKAKKKNNTYVPSGSEADASKRKIVFRFFENMRFLDDVVETKKTLCTLPKIAAEIPPEDVSSGPSTSGTALRTPVGYSSPMASDVSKNSSNASKRKRSCDENTTLQEAILTTLRTPVKEPNGVDAFVQRLAEGLRRLPYRARSMLEISFLQQLMDAEDTYN